MASFLNQQVTQWTKPSSTAPKTVAECWKESLCFWPQLNSLVSVEVIAAGHITYALIIWALHTFMKNRSQPFELKGPMLVYNAVQIVMSTLMTVGLAPYVMNNLFNVGGKFTYDIEFWVLVHYGAKYLDMFDTVFIVLRKKDKQFSFLHVYHHFTIGVIWGGLLHWGVGNGTVFFGAWINSLVHALMYSHYFFTSLGFENPLKTFLTQFQMFQFFLCIVHAVLVIGFETSYPRKVSSIQAVYHPTLLVLFGDYLRKEKALKKKLKQQQVENNNSSAEDSRSSARVSAAVTTTSKGNKRSASKGKKKN